MQNVAIYARYSSDMQSATSVEDQLRRLNDYSAKRGWTVARTYEDSALSGRSLLLRPGVQSLIRDAEAGHFKVILVESLDRLSRTMADLATLHRKLGYLGIELHSCTEGAATTIQVGVRAILSEQYITDLADKTHRGLESQVLRGKSAGGLSFGYRVVRELTAKGELTRGDLEVVPEEADVISRIFSGYVEGMSPNRLADMLNTEGILGPRGGPWDKSAIHGNPKRGSGILNNELYRGRRIWNRQRFVLNPDTGKRAARPNDAADFITKEMPELRIIAQDLWDAVKARQLDRKIDPGQSEAWQKRKAKFLLTGLVKCGCCDGGFSTIAKDRFGCSNARNKGASYCKNRTTITRHDLEGRILHALTSRVMDPDLVKAFAAEYIAERNRLAGSIGDDRAALEKELSRTIKDQDVLVNALLAGTPAERIKAKMAQLERRQKQLETDLAKATTRGSAVLIHPRMADDWPKRIQGLIVSLSEEDGEGQARGAIRGLIEKVVVSPMPTGGKRMTPHVTLHGALAGILRLCLGTDTMPERQKTSCEQEVAESIGFLVAGTGFEPVTFRL